MEHEEEMQRESERVGRHIEEAREDWEAKQKDTSVPGAQPTESDQLPEEGPSEQVPDDTREDAREEAKDSPGVPDES
jgi:hypothetical protein